MKLEEPDWMFWLYIIGWIFTFVALNIILIFFFKSLYLYVAVIVPYLAITFPRFFRDPRTIYFNEDNIFIETKLKKYTFPFEQIKKLEMAYLSRAVDYKIKVKNHIIPFYLSKRAFGDEKLEDFIMVLRSRI